jgi:hypothetical protein
MRSSLGLLLGTSCSDEAPGERAGDRGEAILGGNAVANPEESGCVIAGFRKRVGNLASTLLFSMLTACCSAPPATTRDHPPPPPHPSVSSSAATPRIPEPIYFTEKGCIFDGQERAGDTFNYEGQLCACYKQRLYCHDASDRRCFSDGEWFEPGAKPPGHDDGSGLSCRCVSNPTSPPRWSCVENGLCPAGRVLLGLRFMPGSATLSAEDHVKLEGLVQGLAIRKRRRVTLEGHADASEGGAAVQLAQRRAEAVRAAMVKLGVDRSRITITNSGTNPVPAPSGLPPACDASGFIVHPGPSVVFWLDDDLR